MAYEIIMDTLFIDDPVDTLFIDDVLDKAGTKKIQEMMATGKNKGYAKNSNIVASIRNVIRNNEMMECELDYILTYLYISMYFGFSFLMVNTDITYLEDIEPVLSYIKYLSELIAPDFHLYVTLQTPESIKMDFREYMKKMGHLRHCNNVKLCANGKRRSDFDKARLKGMLEE